LNAPWLLFSNSGDLAEQNARPPGALSMADTKKVQTHIARLNL